MAPFVTPYLVRTLCENTFNGGGGHLPNEVGDMSLDQILLCIGDIKYIKSKSNAIQKFNKGDLSRIAKNGIVKVKTHDGTVVEIPITKGKSVVARMAEKAMKKQATEKNKSRRHKRGI